MSHEQPPWKVGPHGVEELSWGIGRKGKLYKSKGLPVAESVKQLDTHLKEKYGLGLEDCLNCPKDGFVRSRRRQRRKTYDPMALVDNPAKFRRGINR